MHFVNDIGSGLFGAKYHSLEPQRPETGNVFLEFVRIPQGRKSRKPKARPEQHTAARVKIILDESTLVVDRYSDMANPKIRPASPGDIAILCQTHSQAARYADCLQQLGVPVRINREGWLSSPLVAAACNALAFVADPTDAHAALCLLTLGPKAMPLQEAMTALADGMLFNAPYFEPLLMLVDAAKSTPLRTLVPKVVSAAGLRDWANCLPEATQMRADLLRFEGEVRNFEEAHLDMKAAAGFYGQSAQVFLGWLYAQKGERDFDRHPDPGSDAVDGVEIITWHASKGREWNIVFVVGLDQKIGEKPGTMRAEFEDFSDLDNVLNKALLRYTPNLSLKEKRDLFIEAKRQSAEQTACRLLYVALTRARDRLVLEWPDFTLKKPSESENPDNYAEMLVKQCGLKLESNQAIIAGHSYSARMLWCKDEAVPEFDTPAMISKNNLIAFGELRSLSAGKKNEWRISPSQLVDQDVSTDLQLQIFDLGTPIDASADVFDQANIRGTAWHLVFRTAVLRPDLMDRVCAASSVSPVVAKAIEVQAHSIIEWLKTLNYTQFHCELPIQIQTENGSEINATIDLLAESDDGFLIVDHKSSQVDDATSRYADYRPQLEAYAGIVTELFSHKPVRGIAINWMRLGVVTVEALAKVKLRGFAGGSKS